MRQASPFQNLVTVQPGQQLEIFPTNWMFLGLCRGSAKSTSLVVTFPIAGRKLPRTSIHWTTRRGFIISDFPLNCQDNYLAAKHHKPLWSMPLNQAKQSTGFHTKGIRHFLLHRPCRNQTQVQAVHIQQKIGCDCISVSDSIKVQCSSSQNSSVVTWGHKKEGCRNNKAVIVQVWKLMRLQPAMLQIEHLSLSKTAHDSYQYCERTSEFIQTHWLQLHCTIPSNKDNYFI